MSPEVGKDELWVVKEDEDGGPRVVRYQIKEGEQERVEAAIDTVAGALGIEKGRLKELVYRKWSPWRQVGGKW